MHILFVTPTFPPMPGGGERYAASLAAHLRERGHVVSVVTSAATQESALWEGTSSTAVTKLNEPQEAVIRLSLRPFPGGRSGLMLYRKLMVVISALPGDQSATLSRLAARVPWIDGLEGALAAVGPVDIVHAFNVSWESAMVAGAAFAKQRSVPFVVTPFAHFGVGKHDRVARNSTMDHQLRLMGEAAQVMVLTEIERRGLAGYGIPMARINTLGGSADPLPDDWVSAMAQLDNRNLPRCFALFLGRASRDKGAIDAAEAVLALRRQQHDISLVLAGSSSPEFNRWLAQLPSDQRPSIVPLGLVSEETKHALLERASMLLLPSRSDSFGIVLLEAWQHAKPVIGARAGGIPGVIDDGQNGLLVEYGDGAGLSAAIARLLDNPTLAATLGNDGLRKVTHELTWEQTAARAESTYRLLL